MALPSLPRFWLSFLFLATSLAAQVPTSILVARFRRAEQISATSQQTIGGVFGVQVAFASPPATSVSVQLRRPDGSVHPLTRQADGTYEFEFETGDVARLGTFPDGSYAVLVTGGAAPSTTAFAISAGDPPSPVLITNFDALQAWPNPTPEVTWEAVPGVSGIDQFTLTLARTDGTVLFENQVAASTGAFAVTRMVSPTRLPFSIPLVGELAYYRIASSALNNGSTTLGVATGFAVTFPLVCIAAPPTFIVQPRSQVGVLGETVLLEAAVSGFGNQSFQFQLKRNGLPVPGIAPGLSYGGATEVTYRIPMSQLSDAGTYTIEVSYAGQVVSSDPAVVVVAPHLSLAHLAGAGTYGASDGPATLAQFENPLALAVDAAGNVYVADQLAFVIRVISPNGTVSTLAGTPERRGSMDGVGAAARFSDPTALAVDAAGNVYVADSANGTIRRITPSGLVTTLAGQAGSYGSSDGVGPNARFQSPHGVAVDPAGNLYVSDTASHTIRRVTPAGVVTTLAGVAGAPGSTDGTGSAARFSYPLRSKFHAGDLYVGDQNGLRRVSPTGTVTTLTAVASDSAGPRAVQDVALDANGAIYVATAGGIRRMIAGVSTLVAAGEFGGLAIDAQGNVYASEPRRYTVRKGALTAGSADPGITITAAPAPHTVAAGSSVLLQVAATGPNLAYQWQANGTPIPGATRSVLLAPPSAGPGQVTYSVAIGNSVGFATPGAPPARVVYAATSSPGRISNLSIRSTAGTAAQTLITGLVLSGGGPGASSPYLFRGIGPGLTPFGVAPVLVDPALTVSSGANSAVGFNDDWGGTRALADAFASVGAFALAPASRDAALIAPLTDGAYTVGVSGKDDIRGLALAEIYALPAGAAASRGPQIVNLSARTQVGTGGDVLIAGFAVAGSTSKTLLIRGVGPTLAAFGVPGALADPLLQIFSGATLIARSDNWSVGADADMGVIAAEVARRVGAFGLETSRDAALVVTLAPGAYTAQVSGVGTATGVALVEIYEVP
jgi:sugar lactone lactonase YvrE